MIDEVRLLYPGSVPDLCNSATYFDLFRSVLSAQSWVRYSALGIGVLITLFLFRSFVHGRWVGVPGYMILAIISGLAVAALSFFWSLNTDVAPYRVASADLCRYHIREAHVVRFGRWLSVGSSWSRFERVYWEADGLPVLRGRSPFVRAILSAFLDTGDTVFIGIDPRGVAPPVFLGAKKQPPPVLVQEPPATLREMYVALKAWAPVSRRWRDHTLGPTIGGD